jgi:hypothetical protein
VTTMPFEALARTSDPHTSHTAAAHITPRAGTIRAEVLDIAKGLPHGFTHRDMVAHYQYRVRHMDAPPTTDSSVRTRVHELVQAGDIHDSGRLVTSPHGRSEIIWEYRP